MWYNICVILTVRFRISNILPFGVGSAEGLFLLVTFSAFVIDKAVRVIGVGTAL